MRYDIMSYPPGLDLTCTFFFVKGVRIYDSQTCLACGSLFSHNIVIGNSSMIYEARCLDLRRTPYIIIVALHGVPTLFIPDQEEPS